jgi:hypothetical protein
MRRSQIILFLLFLSVSCIDPFTLKTGSESGLLVVDGLVTNAVEKSYVRLSRSLTFDNTRIPPAYLDPVANAVVTLKNEMGEEVPLTESETEKGLYLPPASFQGTPGVSYTLLIVTSEGEHYQSLAETMPGVTPIHDLLYEYYVYEELIKNSQGVYYTDLRFGFKLMVQVNDPDSERNFYRWKISGIFEFFSFIGETWFQCWAPVPRLEPGIKVQDDVYTNGNLFTEVLCTIPYDRQTYYLATVQQQSLTPEAYRFWNELKKQQTNTGSIFDPIPSQIKGNIFNADDPDELVLGYFGASSLVESSVLINRFRASGFVSPSPNFEPEPGNCLNQIEGAINIKPPGFP